ncbi:UNVERIFIED_CONTAM: hypothetical protein Scaly_2047000 [Sesamum calycinum]|uniref:Reverse transcriptase domain-containing protein n=1 Tax=Sesamum calycinum TaxID=2727403 RepID=A0AAW2N445_9LAMI
MTLDMVVFNKIKIATGEAPLISCISEYDISTSRTWGLWLEEICKTEDLEYSRAKLSKQEIKEISSMSNTHYTTRWSTPKIARGGWHYHVLSDEETESTETTVQTIGHNTLLIRLEHCFQLIYLKVIKLEQCMLQQQAKIQWIKGGDQCSKVFFWRVATRRASIRVFQINDDAGLTITNSDEALASCIISHEDGVRLTRPVSVEEIKLAFFHIAEDKSLGPNVYTTAFYKAAWSVVGGEITRAIMDFFINGRLLKQELFTGYNQQNLPKRCALNVDLQKAYDTVEWDFLFATIRFFGLPEVFIQWVEECVNTPTFSMIEQETAFRYHWHWAELSLFQRGFANNLLLFCEAHDPSIAVFQRELELFAILSRLHLIKSVRMALSTYWVMAFILAKAIIKEIEKRLRSFLSMGTQCGIIGGLQIAYRASKNFEEYIHPMAGNIREAFHHGQAMAEQHRHHISLVPHTSSDALALIL